MWANTRSKGAHRITSCFSQILSNSLIPSSKRPWARKGDKIVVKRFYGNTYHPLLSCMPSSRTRWGLLHQTSLSTPRLQFGCVHNTSHVHSKRFQPGTKHDTHTHPHQRGPTLYYKGPRSNWCALFRISTSLGPKAAKLEGVARYTLSPEMSLSLPFLAGTCQKPVTRVQEPRRGRLLRTNRGYSLFIKSGGCQGRRQN